MKVLTIGNEKGGVGKTTTAVTIAAGFAFKGYRVLLIDADGQGNATRAAGLTKEPMLYDWLVRNKSTQEVLRPVPPEWYGIENSNHQGQFWILPGNVETMHISQAISDASRLRKRLSQLASIFDLVIIDTGPTPSLLHGAVYAATDYMVYPTLCEKWSFEGLAETVQHTQQANEALINAGGDSIQLLGIIPTRYKSNTVLHTSNLDQLRERYGALVWEPIPDRVVWGESAVFNEPIFVYAAGTAAADDAWAMIDRVEQGVFGG